MKQAITAGDWFAAINLRAIWQKEALAFLGSGFKCIIFGFQALPFGMSHPTLGPEVTPQLQEKETAFPS